MVEFSNAVIKRYEPGRPNEPITLYSGVVEADIPLDEMEQQAVDQGLINADFYHLIADCQINLRWSPEPGFSLEMNVDGHKWANVMAEDGDTHLQLPDIGYALTASFEQLSGGPNRPMNMVFRLPSDVWVSRANCCYLALLIANFAVDLCRGKEVLPLRFEADGWGITLDCPTNAHYLFDLRKEGGYAITHTGLVTRLDNCPFSPESAKDILDCMNWFLHFCAGAFVGIPVRTGYNADNPVHIEWHNGRISNWAHYVNWFSRDNPLQIQTIFTQFRIFWSDPFWKENLMTIVQWYLMATMKSADLHGSIALALIALKRLCWAILVIDRKALSQDGFNRLCSHDNLNLLLQQFSIPTEISASLPALSAYAARYNLLNMPQAITAIRNAIVHPLNRPIQPEVAQDAWTASVWCLEIVLLKLLKFKGTYFDRLTVQYQNIT